MKPEELFVAPTAVLTALAGFASATIGGTLEPRLGFAVGEARNGADGVRAQLAPLGAHAKVLFVAESSGLREQPLGFLLPSGVLARSHSNPFPNASFTEKGV